MLALMPGRVKVFSFTFLLLILFLEISAKDFFPTRGVSEAYSQTMRGLPFLQGALALIAIVVNILATYGLPNALLVGASRSLLVLFVANNSLSLLVITSSNLLAFYIFFELSAIPIFFMIIGWGYQPEKVKAGYAILIYTVLLAAPFILSVAIHKLNSEEWHISFSQAPSNTSPGASVLRIMSLTAFIVKLPLYSVHLWLPMAHVEAPVFGSIILAGVLLKFGGLGALVVQALFKSIWIETILAVVAISGLLAVRLIMAQLTDLKIIIAYTRVAHIGFVPVRFFIRQATSISSGTLIMLTHAFSSSGMFMAAYVVYKISNSRNLLINKGLMVASPYMAFLWLMTVLASIGTPPNINLVSEVLCISVCIKHFMFLAPLMGASFVVSRAVHLVIYRSIAQGHQSSDRLKRQPLNASDSVVVISHILFCVSVFPVLDCIF